MTEIQRKSILVRVSARFELARVRVIGSLLYVPYSMMLQRFYQLPFLFQVMEVYGPGDGVRFHPFLFFTSLPLSDKRDAKKISYDKDVFEVKFSLDMFLSSFYRH